ncbi:MAG: hypothetical protein A2W80_03990 [Candidatus Riflebacteria bacterium GWC2_50_8]|nr:MAG: hypothetical protein A2W80_03990 [Candidatus Riflebacteria bacterium GWC2_50_8]
MTNTDYPIARRIMAVNLFIYSIALVVTVWHIYTKNFTPAKISGIVGLCTLLIYLVGGGTLYLKPFSRSPSSDQVVILYCVVLFTSVAIIKWAVFWNWSINTRLLPAKYETWNLIFEMVSVSIAGCGGYLPFLINRKKAQENP